MRMGEGKACDPMRSAFLTRISAVAMRYRALPVIRRMSPLRKCPAVRLPLSAIRETPPVGSWKNARTSSSAMETGSDVRVPTNCTGCSTCAATLPSPNGNRASFTDTAADCPGRTLGDDSVTKAAITNERRATRESVSIFPATIGESPSTFGSEQPRSQSCAESRLPFCRSLSPKSAQEG